MRKVTMGLIAVLFGAGAADAQNLVTNGTFETANLIPWSFSGGWGTYGGAPADGSYGAGTACVGAACTNQANLAAASYLYQDLATTAGGAYTLSFGFAPVRSTSAELKVLWGGTLIADLTSSATTGPLTFSTYSLTATGSSTRLLFLGGVDAGSLRLDDILVTAATVPEPTSWALMVGGFGLIGTALRRRTRIAFA